ncbi:MAG: hypothetical protein FWF65_08400 [Bacteroidetes bacterium]|nr:hypothetical protein [Bacteroidota bacterium]MCL1969550.1 hypothetical protein [Bacteroidota bacterium]
MNEKEKFWYQVAKNYLRKFGKEELIEEIVFYNAISSVLRRIDIEKEMCVVSKDYYKEWITRYNNDYSNDGICDLFVRNIYIGDTIRIFMHEFFK